MTNEPEAELSFGFLLADVSRLLRRNFELRVQSLGLTLTQWRAIAYLSRKEGINQSVLAELLEVKPITLTRLVDRMEEAGWVERRRDPDDRRAVCLHLTDKVQPILESMHSHADATHAAAFAGIKTRDEETTLDTLAKIKTNLLDAARPDDGEVKQ